MTVSKSEHGTPEKNVTRWRLRICQNSWAVRISKVLFLDVRPGALIIFERVHFHPAFINIHGIDVLAVIDELLEHIGERGLFKGRRLVEWPTTIAADDTMIGLAQAFRTSGRK